MVLSCTRCWFAAIAFAAAIALTGTPATAQERLVVELNQLEEVEAGCRGSIVFTNRLDTTVTELTIEVAVFDQEGRVSNLWLLPARRLPPGQIRVRQFLFQEGNCDGIGRLLLNDVVNCEGNGLDPEQCLGLIDVSSRIDLPFVAGVDAGN
jgi:hypothetical protein